MPPPTLLPTPAPSGSLGPNSAVSLSSNGSFALPSPQISPSSHQRDHTSLNAALTSQETQADCPPSKRRKLTDSESSSPLDEPSANANGYELPPPPSRSRKIIHMKPTSSSLLPASHGSPNQRRMTAGASGGSRNSAATAASRKTARKTAHSLIEKRRRGKLNDEFATLKDMVPACRQSDAAAAEGIKQSEWHKLAILQAGIDYIRYLEKCVADLQTNRGSTLTASPPASRRTSSPPRRLNSGSSSSTVPLDHTARATNSISCISLANYATAPRPVSLQPTSHSYMNTPIIRPSTHNPLPNHRHFYSADCSPQLSTTSTVPSYAPSPAMLPQQSSYTGSADLGKSLELGATEALLLLNRDRRGSGGSKSLSPGSLSDEVKEKKTASEETDAGRGGDYKKRALSVRDLLAC